jgi:hypothetical protein
MKATELKIGIALWFTAGLTGAGILGQQPATGADELVSRVEKRVQAWQPTKAERRLDEIGWAKDIRDALQLAKKHGRPVFLFTYSGSKEREDALALRRC